MSENIWPLQPGNQLNLAKQSTTTLILSPNNNYIAMKKKRQGIPWNYLFFFFLINMPWYLKYNDPQHTCIHVHNVFWSWIVKCERHISTIAININYNPHKMVPLFNSGGCWSESIQAWDLTTLAKTTIKVFYICLHLYYCLSLYKFTQIMDTLNRHCCLGMPILVLLWTSSPLFRLAYFQPWHFDTFKFACFRHLHWLSSDYTPKMYISGLIEPEDFDIKSEMHQKSPNRNQLRIRQSESEATL